MVMPGRLYMASIPVIVDSVKQLDNFRMTRCTYLSIENDTPSPDWTLNNELPFMLNTLSGIIMEPFGGGEFVDVGLIDDLFNQIQDTYEFFIGINDLWLPNIIFPLKKYSQGDVFRIDTALFKVAYLYNNGRISDDEYMEKCLHLKEEVPLILFSEVETAAFTRWAERQIDAAKQAYPKDETLALEWE